MFKHRLSPVLCAALISLLTACSPLYTPSEDHSPIATDPPTTHSETAIESAADYQSLIDELKAQLLDLKRQQYEERAAYEANLAALEALIKALEAELEQAQSPSPDTDRPVSTTPSTPPAEGSPDTKAAFSYVVENGTVTILSYLGNDPSVTIPAYVDRYPVTAIADDAFRGTAVTAVTIPSTVQAIGWFAFADCQSLTAVLLPASVESIGYGAFDGCRHLTIYCPPNSYAAAYTQSFGLRHEYV